MNKDTLYWLRKERKLLNELQELDLFKPNLKSTSEDLHHIFDRISFYEGCLKLLEKLLDIYESIENYEKCKIVFDQINIYKIKLNENKNLKQNLNNMGKPD